MRYLQDDNGDTLPLPDDFLITRRAVLFTNFAIAGDFSTDFEVPNNSENRKKIAFQGLNQIEKLIQKPFHFYIDGNKISDGRVFIRSVGATIDLFFVAGNGNWMNQIQGSIKDVDLSSFNSFFDAPTVISRMTATEGIIFPVIDWCYNYRKMAKQFLTLPMVGVSVDSFYDFYPCFYVKTILKELLNSYGYLLAGNLIDDPIYNSIIITPEEIKSAFYSSPLTQTESMVSKHSLSFIGIHDITMISGSAGFDSATNSIIASADLIDVVATLSFTIGDSNISGSTNFTFDIIKDNGTRTIIGTVTFEIISKDLHNKNVHNAIINLTDSISKGDKIILNGHGNPFPIEYDLQGTIILNFTINNYIVVRDSIPDIAQFDFIKYIASRFNCILEFDDLSQTLTFTMLDSIRNETAVDMSENIISYQQIPASGYGKRNFLRLLEATELFNYKTDTLNFGDLIIESDGDTDMTVIQTPFAPAESFKNNNLDWLMTNVPLVKLEDSDTGQDFNTVLASAGNIDLFTSPTGTFIFSENEIVRVESATYNGIFAIFFADINSVRPYGPIPFIGTDSGKLYKQKIVFDNIGSRELIVCTPVKVNDINMGSPIYGDINLTIRNSDSVTYPIDTIAWAYFAKPNINTNIDRFPIGLNYGVVVNTSNITFSSIYNKNLIKIIKGSKLPCQMRMTLTEYMNLDFKKFVFLRTETFTGYFLIESIGGFKDQFTAIDMQLIFMG